MQTSSNRVHAITAEGLPRQLLTLPLGWQAVSPPDGRGPDGSVGEILAIFLEDRTLDPAFRSSATLTRVRSLGSADLPTWQDAVRARRLEVLPDLQILDDREIPDSGGHDDFWYTAVLTTDPSECTLLVRSWSRTAEDQGLTLTLTTLPAIDSTHAETFDAIAGSWRLDEGGRS